MPNVSDLARFYIFADDTAVMIKAVSSTELQNKINSLMPIITDWFHGNRLSLNGSKSNYQIFSKSKVGDLNITLQNTKVERKTSVKYLGVYVDENLKWHNHIAYVQSKISQKFRCYGKSEVLVVFARIDTVIQHTDIALLNLLCCNMGKKL